MANMKINVGIRNWKRNTNILTLKVPEQLKRKIATGIEYVDLSLGGKGFTPSTAMILTGTPGAGKTTMMLQMADALTARGHVALVNTGEESLYQVRNVAERLRLKHGFIADQQLLLSDVLSHGDALIKAHKGKKAKDGNPVQVFIFGDSLQTLDDGFYGNGHTNGNTPVRVAEKVSEWCKDTYGVFVMIGQVNKDGKIAGKNQIKHAVDIHAHLYVDERERSETYGERLFEIEKNRFGCTGTTYILGMEEKGLYEKGSFKFG